MPPGHGAISPQPCFTVRTTPILGFDGDVAQLRIVGAMPKAKLFDEFGSLPG